MSTVPLTVSRVMLIVGLILSLIGVVLLFSLSFALLWVNPLSTAVLKDIGVAHGAVQPWLSIIFAGAGFILLLGAQVMERLLKILKDVSAGDSFHAGNAAHLRRIGALLLIMQGLGAAVGFIGSRLPETGNLTIGFDISFAGVLGAMLAFVLAQVFDKASVMRDELEGTI